MTDNSSVATVGGGCFWCLEAVFLQLRGIQSVVSGYAGGTVDQPTYEQVCSGKTGHAEVVQITFNPDVLTYADLLDVFLGTHDPTTRNRQGADVGTQYRSVIFTHTSEQDQVARERLAHWNASGEFANPIVTEIAPLPTFFPAEDYHQDYFQRNPSAPYCQLVVASKVAGVRQKFAARIRDNA